MPRRLWTTCLTLTLIASFHLSAIANHIERTVIVNTAFTVKAGDAKYWNFRVGNSEANVVGRFRAEGGGGNDIRCLILDADSFENWRNGHRVRSYYNSEKITVANINVRLAEGDYVLVFDNTYSVLTNKAVTANVEMQSYGSPAP
jgi:phosphodiesterase/alkaline phosphatase D-like protein